MNTKQPRDAWIHCERGHLFYSASSNTQCHVCKAHRLPPLSKTPKVTTLDKLMLRYHRKIAALSPTAQESFIVTLKECVKEIDAQNRLGGWVRLPVARWYYDSAHLVSRDFPQIWRRVLEGCYVEGSTFTEGFFDHARHAAAEEAYILKVSREYTASLRQPAPMTLIGTTIERTPEVIVTPPPARATQPLHDAHCQARRKWRKALADMLREERASRDGQTAFRAAVLANYGGRCAITGTAIDVEAAHIEPWRENGNQEPDNGIPMVWALHKCYDRTPAMFAIHPDTLRIHVRPDVVGLEGYNGVQIADGLRTPINRDALRARWATFQPAESF